MADLSILDSIDGALHDWATSEDAMRWVPDEGQKQSEARTEYLASMKRYGRTCSGYGRGLAVDGHEYKRRLKHRRRRRR